MPCLGNADKPCCYIKGKHCQYLKEHDPRAPERRWACGLYLDLDRDWDNVIASDEYKNDVEGSWANGLNCKDWPDGDGANDGACAECGVEYTVPREKLWRQAH